MDKINRILEIARYKETKPNPVNETAKSEYSLKLADGNQYQIIREKSGYIIKQSLDESKTDYIAPIQDRTYFKSYSQALRKLNLMAKEMNEKFGNNEGTSLFSEQKKYVLKTPEVQKKSLESFDDVENIPAPPMGDEMGIDAPPADDAITPDMGTEMPDMGTEMPDMGTEMPDIGGDSMEDEHTTPSMDNDNGTVTFKTIQKLTGKLGQKLRTLNSDEATKMSSKDIKYVLNSIISALDLEALTDEDKEDIMTKFEGEEEGMGSTDEFSTDSDDMSDMGTEESEDVPSDEVTTPEIGEGTWDELGNEIAGKTKLKMMIPGQFHEEEDEDKHHLSRIADSIFMESNVEKVLMKYFEKSESEKTKTPNKTNIIEENKRIKRISESVEQQIGAKKFLRENSNAILLGKSNKRNLVFNLNGKQVKISPKGNII
jgi:nicotinamide mononucleotide adenylyltransferase